MANSLREIIVGYAAQRGRIIVNAGGTTHKGTVVEAAPENDHFGLQMARTGIPGAEGAGLTVVRIRYEAVAWWVDL